jgi:hypothetical protein
METVVFLLGVVLACVLSAFVINCHIQIAVRLGYSAAFGILSIIPLVHLFAIGAAALRPSPNEIKLRRLEREVRRLRGSTAQSQSNELSDADALAQLGE